MKNELKIPGCDYWGEYDGYKVYKCYSKDVPTSTYPNIVFALGNKLFMNGGCIGKVDDVGRVSNWAPARWVKKEEPRQFTVEDIKKVFGDSKQSEVSDIDKADKVLTDSWKRSVEDLVGEKFSSEYKYSE